MIFKGKGFAKAKEEAGYHPDVVVYFQENAYIDTDIIMADVAERLVPHFDEKFPEGDSDHIHFMDNLKTQQTNGFVKELKEKCKGRGAFGPSLMTHVWAPLDRGHLNAILKVIAKSKFSKWMEVKIWAGSY